MDFFTKHDLDYYKEVLDAKITSKSDNWDAVKTQLTKNGVFGKTKHWAEAFNQLGYIGKSRNDCQYSGKLRTYTWGRIYIKGHENTKVYFTVGVGSRLSTSSDDLDLIIKIDCHRKELTPYQVKSFDNYRDTIIKDWLIEISKEDLVSLNWDSLITRTKNFIDKSQQHYKELVKIIWPTGINVQPKVARICWNDLGWEKPSGPDGKSTNPDAFESKGYGHEEWLFDLERVVDGYHYGFIQAFNKGNHHGEKFDIHLYTLKYGNGNAQCYWAGRIKETIVLTKAEQSSIFLTYKDNGWYHEMMKELNGAGVEERDLEIVSEEELFNVKFKVGSENLIIFDELKEIENPTEEIGPGYGRYGIKDLYTTTPTVINTNRAYKFRAGHNPTKTGKSKSEYTKRTINRTLTHKKIQELMYNQLVIEYGKDKVGTEVSTGFGTNIDVVAVQPDNSEWFYEVKTYNQPLICIREAFGQILEYAMFSQNNHADKLIVVGINAPSKSEQDYLNHLREVTSLNIYYQVFDLNQKILKTTTY